MNLETMLFSINSLKLKSQWENNIILRTERKYGILTQLVIKRKDFIKLFCDDEPGPPHFAKWTWDSILSSFMMFVHQNSLYIQFVDG